MTTSEIIDYLNENSYCFKLPSTVEASWDAVQEHFTKGSMVSVIVDADKKEVSFRINLDRDFDFLSGEHFSKAYKFESLDKLAQKLLPNISDFTKKRFKITVGGDVVFDGESTYAEIVKISEPIRIANPSKCVSVTYDLYMHEGEECYKSFIGNVTWNDQLKMFPYYPTYTEEGTSLMKNSKEEYEEKYG